MKAVRLRHTTQQEVGCSCSGIDFDLMIRIEYQNCNHFASKEKNCRLSVSQIKPRER
jgi:hypothetical protein